MRFRESKGQNMKGNYSINRLIYKCKICGNQFCEECSTDNELVNFYFEDDPVQKWMNMFGENGYLDLLDKLMDIKREDDFIQPEVIAFQNKLSEIAGRKIRIGGKRRCPKCDSSEIFVLDDIIIQTENVEILRFPFK